LSGWYANGAVGSRTWPESSPCWDFYDSSIGQLFGVDGALQIEQRMEGMWALQVLALTGALGLILALPVATLAAWRAGFLPWWAALATTAAVVGGFFVLGPTVAAGVVLTAGFLVLAISLASMDRRGWEGTRLEAARGAIPAA
jgi:hypothetical protein